MAIAKSLSVFLMALVAIVQASAEPQCYTCIGYDSALPVHDMHNNPYCVSESFVASEVPKLNSKHGICMAYTETRDSLEITVRYGEELFPIPHMYVYHKGYICQGNLCNSRPTNSAGTPLLLVPLLLIPAVLPCLLA
ncbi:hypothetical protein C7M84_013918 [Penaeus vannamei]|uniref:Uncharacterized protein n=1 Tax=Penaeus vannamei TaxID=6689 RepID=A0A3R7SN21_PENVA|nr:uncharacterized protein LOC113816832 [Penaeus vannamei]ROT67971.1 hypothetical protein C7M84_013918 [Penaeus vannamei]